MKSLLVLCTGNSCRSQIAEGYLRIFLPEWQIYSAGVETHGLNPKAVEVMQLDNIDISNHQSDLIDDYLNKDITHVLTVCDHANEVCPVFPKDAIKFHNNFPDPAKATGSPEEVMDQFIMVRNMIKQYSQDLANKLN